MIYRSKTGRLRVNIGGSSFQLPPTCPPPSTQLAPRQLVQVVAGEYGSVAQEYYRACVKRGLPPSFAWRGILNEFGDHAEVSPMYAPRERDYRRSP